MTTRGERNNDPLNIDRTQIDWEGDDCPQVDPRFIDFVDAVWCYRVAARIVRRHAAVRNTIALIVTSWAPGTENDTEAYIADVSARTGLGRDVPLNITREVGDPCDLVRLFTAMTWHEDGECIYAPEVIQHGLDLEITA